MKSTFVILSLLILSCSSIEQPENETHENLKAIFTASEVSEILVLHNFFYESICQEQGAQTETDCFVPFFKTQNENYEKGVIELSIPFDQQQLTYAKLSENTFNAIWVKNAMTLAGSHDKTVHLDVNTHGKYVDYLNIVAEQNPSIKIYLDAFMAAGDLQAVDLGVYEYTGEETLDFKVVCAIHFLTLNDRFYRNE